MSITTEQNKAEIRRFFDAWKEFAEAIGKLIAAAREGGLSSSTRDATLHATGIRVKAGAGHEKSPRCDPGASVGFIRGL